MPAAQLSSAHHTDERLDVDMDIEGLPLMASAAALAHAAAAGSE